LSDCNVDKDKCEKHPGESSSFSLPRASLELLSRIKAGIFQKLGVTSFYGAVSSVSTFEEGNASDFLDKTDLETCGHDTDSYPVSRLQSTEDSTPYDEVIRIHERSDVPISSDSKSPDQSKQFDVIDNCSDHHFFNEGKGLPLSQVTELIHLLRYYIESISADFFSYPMLLCRLRKIG
jgi:ubiquitin-conjugating enzyme E2 O